ncbi:protein FAR1-RELATED SEQUENCE 5-like [Ziziphus jujuba]|uniref:Protein FAR1-RELATED SEQUENCE n=1 Tax=Ziziphus jujuba TaxID=326968 RepID=A0ABM3ZTT9_ZIZJJ|nr:protein FAR1-RELATED SEQUENCE 5-like [Ziziphus jujuba]
MDNDSYVGKDINMSLEDEDKKDEGNITGQEQIEAIHCKILDEMIPKVGIEFKSEDEAYNFYNAYAYKVGSGIRRGKGHKDQSGKMKNRTFCCCCEGFPEKDKRNINVKSHHAKTRFGCLARMKINLDQTGKYCITDFIAQHTHVTSTPSKSHLHRSQRKLIFVQAAEIDIGDSSGTAPKASLELMAKQVGGYENLGFICDDYKNYLKTKKTIQMKVGEIGGVLEYLQSMQLEDPYFFYAIQVDQDDLIRVNHHKQTTIFGAALLYDENVETFIWLFDTFVKAMSAKHLSGVFVKFREFTKDFSSCIYDYEEEQEFFLAWNAMLKKYDLKDNDWLIRMFDLRKKWALVYGRETFCADMTTTQRSESMNNVSKNYVSYQHNLLRFFEHFQRLIEDHRYEELKADFKVTQSTPSLSFPVEILKDAASIYTPTVFKVFQDELCKAYDCAMQIFDHIGIVTEYKLTNHKKQFQHNVRYDFSDNTVICSCRKFEFTGILCSHALKVISSKDTKKILIQYILKRWTKSAKLGNSEFVFANTINEDPKVSLARRYKDLCRLQTQVATKATETEETYKIARTALAKILEDVDAYLKDNDIGKSISKIIEATTVPSASEKIKGIKNKKRVHGKSTRPRNALERVRKKKNVALGEPSQQQSHSSEIAHNDVSSNFNSQDLLNLPFNIVHGYHGDQHSLSAYIAACHQYSIEPTRDNELTLDEVTAQAGSYKTIQVETMADLNAVLELKDMKKCLVHALPFRDPHKLGLDGLASLGWKTSYSKVAPSPSGPPQMLDI